MFAKNYVIILGLAFLVVSMVTAQDNGDEDEIEPEDPVQQDFQFDSEVVTTAARPSSPASRGRVTTLLRGVSTPVRSSSIFVTNEYYRNITDWYVIYRRCCPRRQNYDCQSYRRTLPCFFDYFRKEWCCPIYPRVHIHNCNCENCALFDANDCVTLGKCRRRYRKTRFWAVCFSACGWNSIRLYDKFLPSSCYCRTSSSICPVITT